MEELSSSTGCGNQPSAKSGHGMGGSVVEFSPATREARVRFPAHAESSPFWHSLTHIHRGSPSHATQHNTQHIYDCNKTTAPALQPSQLCSPPPKPHTTHLHFAYVCTFETLDISSASIQVLSQHPGSISSSLRLPSNPHAPTATENATQDKEAQTPTTNPRKVLLGHHSLCSLGRPGLHQAAHPPVVSAGHRHHANPLYSVWERDRKSRTKWGSSVHFGQQPQISKVA